MKTIIALASTAAALAFAAPASADVYSFVLGGTDGFTPEAAAFTIDTASAPDYFVPGAFVAYDLPGAFSYGTDTDTEAFVYFYNAGDLGGIAFEGVNNPNVLVITDGPQLYTGPESMPTGFTTGTFQLTDYFTGEGGAFITITDLTQGGGTGAVPEPASWAMMISGFGLVGGAMRARRVKASMSLA